MNNWQSVACMLTFCGALGTLEAAELVDPVAEPKECVILMHGLARTQASMKAMSSELQRHGYLVVNHSYPSRHYTIEELSGSAIPVRIDQCRQQASRRIHFVTHSLGGILVRHYLQHNNLPELGRVVMLAPPNQGSEVVDVYKNVPGYTLINGPAGSQLGTGDSGIPGRLDPVAGDTAIIAGSSTINFILSLFLPNPDDGKVSVASTRVDGMCAHLLVPVSHPFIMKNDRVIEQVLSYLRIGRFTSADAEYLDCEVSDGDTNIE